MIEFAHKETYKTKVPKERLEKKKRSEQTTYI